MEQMNDNFVAQNGLRHYTANRRQREPPQPASPFILPDHHRFNDQQIPSARQSTAVLITPADHRW
jgi:hypothetical protein